MLFQFLTRIVLQCEYAVFLIDASCIFAALVCVDFRRRFISLLAYEFRGWSSALALSVLHQPNFTIPLQGTFSAVVVVHLTFELCILY